MTIYRIRQREIPRARIAPHDAVPIFVRGEHIGSVSSGPGGQFWAGLRDGRAVGLFTSAQAAAHALIEAHGYGDR